MKRFSSVVMVLLLALSTTVSQAKDDSAGIGLNRLRADIDGYDSMMSPIIKDFGVIAKATSDIKQQSFVWDVIRPMQNFQTICSYIGYILNTKEFIDPSNMDAYYKFILNILVHSYQDLTIEHKDLQRKCILLKNIDSLNIANKAKKIMVDTLDDIKMEVQILKNGFQ